MASKRGSSNSNDRDMDCSKTESERSSVCEGHDLSPEFDELMKTLDDDPSEFNPKDHWVSCVGRFMYEINPFQNWFLVQDPPYTGRTLDIPATFAPTGPCPLFGKLLSLISAVALLVWGFVEAENKAFFLAYLHTWNLIYSIIYLYTSFLNTVAGVAQPYSRVNGTVRINWFMFIVAAQTGILEAMLFWGRECDYSTVKYDFLTLTLHGGVALEVFLDGFTVNTIPLRWMHWWGCCLLPNMLYYSWTVIHGFFLYAGNPDVPGQNSIYESIEWRFHWKRTFYDMLIVLFVISPLVFLMLWMMSMYKWCCCCCFVWRRERRRYLEETGNLDKYREVFIQQEIQRQEKEAVKEKERAAKDKIRQEKQAIKDKKQAVKEKAKKEKEAAKEKTRKEKEAAKEVRLKEKERKKSEKNLFKENGARKQAAASAASKQVGELDETSAFLDLDGSGDVESGGSPNSSMSSGVSSRGAGRKKDHSL